MNTLAAFYHQRMALVDLAAGTASSVPLPPDALQKGLGGPALAEVLAEQYPGALIFAAGPLTGGFAPASGLMTATMPQQGGGMVHLALPLGHGAWLRQSGFDVLVLTGKSTAPRVVRCGKGQCGLAAAPAGLSGCHTGGRTALRAALLRGTADGRAGLILADTLEEGAALPPAAGSEYGSLPHGALLSAALRAKNVMALCLEGGSPLPPMPVPLDNPLRRAVLPAKGGANQALLHELELEAGKAMALPPSMRWKSAACYHCPSPCLAWIEAEQNRQMLAGDHAALAALLAADAPGAASSLNAGDEKGVDCVVASAPAPVELSAAMRVALILGVCPRLVRREASLSRDVFAATVGAAMAARLPQAESLLTQRVLL